MASGKLGTADLAATTLTTVYTVPASTLASMTVRFTNRTSSVTSVRLATSTSATPALSEYLEYDVQLSGNGVLEATGIVAAAGSRVVAYASAVGVSVNVFGFEE